MRICALRPGPIPWAESKSGADRRRDRTGQSEPLLPFPTLEKIASGVRFDSRTPFLIKNSIK